MATGFNTKTGQGKYNLQFETNIKEHYLFMQDMARKCVDGNLNTMADRIRSMTDEELAHELAKVAGWDRKEYEKAKRIGIEKVILDILKQPANMEKTT